MINVGTCEPEKCRGKKAPYNVRSFSWGNAADYLSVQAYNIILKLHGREKKLLII